MTLIPLRLVPAADGPARRPAALKLDPSAGSVHSHIFLKVEKMSVRKRHIATAAISAFAMLAVLSMYNLNAKHNLSPSDTALHYELLEFESLDVDSAPPKIVESN